MKWKTWLEAGEANGRMIGEFFRKELSEEADPQKKG